MNNFYWMGCSKNKESKPKVYELNGVTYIHFTHRGK